MRGMPPADANLGARLPTEWRVRRLRDVLIRSQYGLTAPAAQHGTVPIVGMKDLVDGRVVTSGLAYISAECADIETYRLRPGDILLNRTNSPERVGKIGIVTEPTDAIFASYLVRLEADRTQLSPDFLNVWLNTSAVQQMIDRIKTRAISQANINPTRFLEECHVPVPTPNEQISIVEINSTWDRGIAAADALLDASSKHVLGLTSLYLDPFIPGTSRENAALPLIRLEESFVERNEGGHDREPLLAITGDRGVVKRDDIERRDTSAEDKGNYRLILPGDIGYNTMRMWQGVCGLSTLRGIISPAYTVVTPRPEVMDGAFAAALFKAPHMIEWLRRYSQGIVDDTLNLKFEQFRQIRIRLPPLDTQRRIANAIHAIRAEADVTARLATKLRQQKQTLMTQLLSGALRVPQRKANSNVQMENANA
jgi:type I restriction enzyme S subunit